MEQAPAEKRSAGPPEGESAPKKARKKAPAGAAKKNLPSEAAAGAGAGMSVGAAAVTAVGAVSGATAVAGAPPKKPRKKAAVDGDAPAAAGDAPPKKPRKKAAVDGDAPAAAGDAPPKKPRKKAAAAAAPATSVAGASAADGGIQSLSQIEQIKLRPGYVVGSVVEAERSALCGSVAEDGTLVVERKTVKVVPALLKIADEAFSNALDEACKGHGVRNIRITVTETTITVWNDGDGIPCGMHSRHADKPVPQVAFGVLSTSSNYDDGEDRVVAGLNGLGIKLANLFSSSFSVKVRHAATGDTYEQSWSDGMTTVGLARVKKGTKPMSGYVSVSFSPVAEFLAEGRISDDTRSMLMHRAMEVSLAAPSNVKVTFNETVIKCDSIRKYMQTVMGPCDFMAVDDSDPNWLVGVAYSGAAAVYSIANGVSTPDGGVHVDHVKSKLMAKLIPAVRAKKACKDATITPASMHAHSAYFVVARVNRPDFKGQTKDALEGCDRLSDYKPSDAFVAKIASSAIATDAIEEEQAKTGKRLARLTDGKKVANVVVEKLYDASWAGTGKSKQAMLILTEGDSALSFALAGRSEWGPEKVGCFPLKGKPMNPRDKSAEAQGNNKELSNIKKILGLKTGEDSADNLRYGSVIILSDADADGSHIRGLIINLFHFGWPKLAKSGFLKVLPTPLIVSRRGSTKHEFMSTGEFDTYAASNDMRGFSTKYYKGLGSWTPADARDIFKRIKPVSFVDSEDADSAIAMAFGKDPTNVKDRKDLVVRTTANPPAAETYRANVPISRFFQTDYAIYAEYDVDRKIPSVCDGLKTCARKIMWVAWERNYVCSASRVKVAQLGAAVAERTMYLHGETSLSTAVVTLAQNFTGTNNCSLLFPDGDFGTRVGNPPSAARYIHTHLTDFASSIFSKLDKAVMKYRTEEGVSIEPAVLYPCLPPILINGNQCAIATGFSCEVPSYKPEDVMANVRNFIAGRPFVDMTPWFRGFTGKVLPGKMEGDVAVSWRTEGVYKADGEDLIVTEVPIGKTFIKMKEQYSSEKSPVKLIEDRCTESKAYFKVRIEDAPAAEKKGVAETLGLVTYVSLRNMHLFDPEGKIKLYGGTAEILQDFCAWRLAKYGERKEHMLGEYAKSISKLANRARFISAVVADPGIVFGRSRAQLIGWMETEAFDTHDGSHDYLAKIPIDSFTADEAERAVRALEAERAEAEKLRATTPAQLWTVELDAVKGM